MSAILKARTPLSLPLLLSLLALSSGFEQSSLNLNQSHRQLSTVCSAGQYILQGMSSCEPCPAGFSCINYNEIPIQCEFGTFSPSGVQYCTVCSAGKQCLDRASESDCASGQYSTQGMGFCEDCQAGFKCISASIAPIPCPSGTYSPPQASSCTVCPQGSFCPSSAQADPLELPIQCPKGFYTPSTGYTDCLGCPAGFKCAALGTSSPVECSSGEYSLGYSETCTQCPKGYSCESKSAAPTPCPFGTYSAVGVASCTTCKSGQECSRMDQNVANTCSANSQYRILNEESPVCRSCPPGHKCESDPNDSNLDLPPEPCDAGSYSASGGGSCQTVAGGSFAETPFESPEACPSGTYSISVQNSASPRTTCIDCPPGFFCSSATAAPQACADGTYSLGRQSSCTTCQEGYVCNEKDKYPVQVTQSGFQASGNSVSQCVAGQACPMSLTAVYTSSCSVGYYSLDNWPYCLPCPVGMSCPNQNSTVPCQYGYVSDLGSATCSACPRGKACYTADTQAQVTCPDGFYSPAGEIHCLACPKGYSCNATDDTLTACSEGTFSEDGMMSCHACPKGFQCPFTDQAIIQQCAPGTYSLGSQQFCIECPHGKTCEHRDTYENPAIGLMSIQGTGIANVCPAGWYCTTSSSSYTAKPCPKGSYSPAGSQECTTCSDGAACIVANQMPSLCPDGMVQSNTNGLDVCTPCPQKFFASDGKSCNATGVGNFTFLPALTPQECRVGTYADGLDMMCYDCQPGSICMNGSTAADGTNPNYNSSNPAPTCPDGFFCNPSDEFSAAWNVQICPQGMMMKSGGDKNSQATACEDIEAGYYLDNMTKTACPYGHYCPTGTKRATEFPCPAGTYNPNEQQTSLSACLTCDAGHFCPEGSGRMFECPPGAYCDSTGIRDSQHRLGTQGYKFGGSKSTSASDTSATYTSDAGVSWQILKCTTTFCPVASFKDYFCQAGYYTHQDDTTNGLKSIHDCRICDEGKVCPRLDDNKLSNGTASFSSYICDEGFVCPVQTEGFQQKPCPFGTIDNCQASGSCPLTSISQCSACPAGFACEQGTSVSGRLKNEECEPGHYCPQSSLHVRQYKCPGGTYNSGGGSSQSSQCSTCEAGTYCPPGSRKPLSCPSGFYCPQGTESYLDYPCDDGSHARTYYTAVSEGLRSQSECSPCPIGHFCQKHQVVPIKCPKGTYFDVEGAKRASATNLDGATIASSEICKECTSGYMCPYEGMTQPIPCDQGYFSGDRSQTCHQCIRGRSCLNSKTTLEQYAAATCPAGDYCQSLYPMLHQYPNIVGDSSFEKISCPEGFFCEAGTFKKQACPAGSHGLSVGGLQSEAQCVLSEAGYYISDPQGLMPFDSSSTNTFYADGFKPRRQVMEREKYNGLCDVGHMCEAGSNSPKQRACDPGTYQPELGQATCIVCPAGYYCQGTTSKAVICPQGHFCEQGSSYAKPCLAGTFGSRLGLTASSECSSCLPGHFCSEGGLSFPDGLCDPGFYCTSGATKSAPTDGVTGNVCPQGGYCEMGSRAKVNCPPGTFRSTSGGRSRYDCQPCSPGSYCLGDGTAAPNGLCSAGYYCPIGSKSQTQMASLPGYYSQEGASVQTACAEGTFQNLTAQSSCQPCPAGFLCETTGISDNLADCPRGHYCPQGTLTAQQCPIGTFNNEFNRISESECKDCWPGYACPSLGLVEPEQRCQPGYFCIKKSTSRQPSQTTPEISGPCPVGHYCPEGTAWPLPCKAGTYQASQYQTRESACLSCTAGSYCSVEGLSAPQGLCDEGFFCPAGSKQQRPTLNFCNAGQFCPQGSATAQNCPAGSYQSQAFQASCLDCPAGFFCEEAATNFSSNVCPTGHYCRANTEYSTQYPCARGYYNPVTGAQTCIQCDPGKYCDDEGLSAPSGDCKKGYYCIGGSTAETPSDSSQGQQCPVGHYCPTGSPTKLPCKPGQACPNQQTDDTEVQGCQEGYYCSIQATTLTPTDDSSAEGGNRCPAGFYCPANSSWPVPCGIGTYNSRFSQTSDSACTTCDVGKYCGQKGLSQPQGDCASGYICQAGSTSPTPSSGLCQAGNACASGALAAVPCASGYYQPKKGQGACLECPKSFVCNATAATACPTHHYCPQGTSTAQLCANGTYTFARDAYQSYDCQSCPPGMICYQDTSADTIVMAACPAGAFCTGGASSTTLGSSACQEGSFCPQGSHAGTPCPPGFACSQQGMAQYDTNTPCQAGYYCIGGASAINPEDGETGNKCPAGHYCPQGSSYPIPCAIGKYSSTFGNTQESQCLSCDQGRICNQLGATTQQNNCPEGFYCQDSTSKTACPIGNYCPSGSHQPTNCSVGTFMPQTHAAQCYACLEGFYCDEVAMSKLKECPQGSYCPTGSQSAQTCDAGTFNPFTARGNSDQCLSCIEGYYCPSSGQIEVDKTNNRCAQQYYCSGGDTTASSKACPEGSYCSTASSTPIACPVGTYTDGGLKSSQSECLACRENFFCPLRGGSASSYGFLLSGQYACGDGYKCISGVKSESPVPQSGVATYCPLGQFCSKGTVPGNCLRNFYNPNTAQSQCLACPASKVCDSEGMSTPGECPEGKYCPELSTTLATTRAGTGDVTYACPVGTYNPFKNRASQAECITCKAGYACNSASLTNPTTLCSEGYFCPEGSTDATPSSSVHVMGSGSAGTCPQGYTCPEGTTAPIPCSPGTYKGANDTTCQQCKAGRYCPQFAMTEEDVERHLCAAGYYCQTGAIVANPTDLTADKGAKCPINNYCPAASTAPTPCPDGSYEPREGSSSCQICPEGFFCSGGSKTECSGGYCPRNSTSPSLCEPGYHHNDKRKLRYAYECAFCPTGKYCNNGVIQGDCAAGFYCDYGAQLPDQGAYFVTSYTSTIGVQVLFIINQKEPLTDYINSIRTQISSIKSQIIADSVNTTVNLEIGAINFYDISSCTRFGSSGTDVQTANRVFQFSTDVSAFETFLTGIDYNQCNSGILNKDVADDLNKALQDGLDSNLVNWNSAYEHVIFVVNDAPPHGEFYWNNDTFSLGSWTYGDQDYNRYGKEYTLEPLLDTYCNDKRATIYLFDILFTSEEAQGITYYRNFTDQWMATAVSHNSTCIKNVPLFQNLGTATQQASRDQNLFQSTLSSLLTTFVGLEIDKASQTESSNDKRCPSGHYCPAGTLIPIRCETGKYTNTLGAASISECQDCQPGYFCLKNDATSRQCPKGHFCTFGNEEPTACPPKTYNKYKGGTSRDNCLNCPPGSYCDKEGTEDWEDYLCPEGHYCPEYIDGKTTRIKCPAGSYLDSRGAKIVTDCKPCPEGFFCQIGSINPTLCNNGTHCPENSTQETVCEKGKYCPYLATRIVNSPAGFYQPFVKQDFYIKCQNGTYCAAGALSETQCPAGFVGSSAFQPIDQKRGCIKCDDGFYSPEGENQCIQCTPGYVCNSETGTVGRRRLSHKGRELQDTGACPKGYYCQLGTSEPTPCPRGTYQPEEAQFDVSSCKACPNGFYQNHIGQESCVKCDGSSNSIPEATTCECIGRNRVYQSKTGQCLCKPGFEPSDGSSTLKDSDVDCAKKVYQRCTADKDHDSNGICRNEDGCANFCGGSEFVADFDQNLGICSCNSAVNAKEVCDGQCIKKLPQLSFTASGNLVLDIKDQQTGVEKEQKIFTRDALNELIGEARCELDDYKNCAVLKLGKSQSTGDFFADFQLPSVLSEAPQRRLHTRYYRRNLQDAQKVITNPVVCLTAGGALVFEGVNVNHYPVYNEDSLLNSNAEFDFSEFLQLQKDLAKGKYGNQTKSFIFTFQSKGIYVFKDSDSEMKETVVAVMQAGSACPTNLIFEAKKPSALLRVGAAKRDDISLTPDWAFFFGSCGAAMFLFVFFAVIFSYIYNKNWDQDPNKARIKYQNRHYTKVARCDIDDPKAVISINSDASAFQFRQQGQEDEIMKAKREAGSDKKKEQKVQTLDLDKLENLKDGLEKQGAEMEQMYDEGEPALEIGNDSEGQLSDDPEIIIRRIKLHLENGTAQLKGEEVAGSDEEHVMSSTSDSDEKAEIDPLGDKLEQKDEKEQEALEQKMSDAVKGIQDEILGDIFEKSDEILQKLKRQQTNVDDDERKRLLEQVAGGYADVEELLNADKNRQNDLLKQRMEARRRRRKKLQNDLDDTQNAIDEKKKEIQQKKDDIVEKHNKEYEKEMKAIQNEQTEEAKKIDAKIDDLKADKMADHLEKLRDAQKGDDFGKELDSFSKEQDRIESEMERQRKHEKEDLERRLKNRRNRARSKKELAINDDIANAVAQDESEMADLQGKKARIQKVLLADQGTDAPSFKDEAEKTQQTSPKAEATELDVLIPPEVQDEIEKEKSRVADAEYVKEEKLEKIDDAAQKQAKDDKKEAQAIQEDALRRADSAVERIADDLQDEITKKKELEEALKKAKAKGDPDEINRLLKQIGDSEDKIRAALEKENAKQQKSLADRLAARRGRRKKKGEDQIEAKKEVFEKVAQVEVDAAQKQDDLRRNGRREAFKAKLAAMQMEIPADELAKKLLSEIDGKNNKEIEDKLKDCFKIKAKKLKDNLVTLAEQSAQTMDDISKDYKTKKNALKELQDKLAQKMGTDPDEFREKNKDEEKKLDDEEAQELQKAKNQYELDKKKLADEIQDKANKHEADELAKLKEEQLKEKKELLDEFIPDEEMRGMLAELDEEDLKALDAFKREQEEQQAAAQKRMQEEQDELQAMLDKELQKLQALQHRQSVSGKVPDKKKLRKTMTMFNPLAERAQIQDKKAQGQKDYEELGEKYVDEREKQQRDLEEKMRLRMKERSELLALKEKKRLEEEEREMKLMQEKLEREKVAKQELLTLKTSLRQRRKYLYHSGFSLGPLEQYNHTEQDIKNQVDLLQAESGSKAVSAAQYDKIKDFYDRIQKLDKQVRGDVRALKTGNRFEDVSDVGSLKSYNSRISSRSRFKKKQRTKRDSSNRSSDPRKSNELGLLSDK